MLDTHIRDDESMQIRSHLKEFHVYIYLEIVFFFFKIVFTPFLFLSRIIHFHLIIDRLVLEIDKKEKAVIHLYAGGGRLKSF